MGTNSKIEWTDHTFNPWIGCTKVSDGCKHCYAEQIMDKHWKKVQWGPQGMRVKTSDAKWREPFKWDAAHAGQRQRVFCASLADVFEDNPQVEEWRARLFDVVETTPNLDWLLLTKRPQNVLRMIPQRWLEYFPKNIWMGTSVENQKAADERIPELVKIPAVVRFLSCEPLLEKVDLDLRGKNYGVGNEYVNWVICGGESGPHARPMHPDWARNIRDECVQFDIPFLFKQWGVWMPVVELYDDECVDRAFEYCDRWCVQMEPNGSIPVMMAPVGKEGGWHEYQPCPGSWIMAKVGKEKAGRLLDSVEWNQFPVPEVV